MIKHPFLLQKEVYTQNNNVNNIMINILKAYNASQDVFHTHFKQYFDILLRTELRIKDKYLSHLYNEEDLYAFVDGITKYRIGLAAELPNKNTFLYTVNSTYANVESLDEILERIMYSSYPPEVLSKFKVAFESYIDNEHIVDLVLSKLELI